MLHAGTGKVSALAAAGLAVGAAVAVPLGPWVEVRRKRPVMVARGTCWRRTRAFWGLLPRRRDLAQAPLPHPGQAASRPPVKAAPR